jgi:hypothetical protein
MPAGLITAALYWWIGSRTPAEGSGPDPGREHANLWGLFHPEYVLDSRDEGELVAKLVWRVKLVTELEAGETTEVEVARLERDEHAGPADLGLRLAEAKQLMATIQAEIVPVQVTVGFCQ